MLVKFVKKLLIRTRLVQLSCLQSILLPSSVDRIKRQCLFGDDTTFAGLGFATEQLSEQKRYNQNRKLAQKSATRAEEKGEREPFPSLKRRRGSVLSRLIVTLNRESQIQI